MKVMSPDISADIRVKEVRQFCLRHIISGDSREHNNRNNDVIFLKSILLKKLIISKIIIKQAICFSHSWYLCCNGNGVTVYGNISNQPIVPGPSQVGLKASKQQNRLDNMTLIQRFFISKVLSVHCRAYTILFY